MIVLTALVATFGLVMFARSIDVSGLAATSLDQLSAKRFNDLSGGASSRLGSATYLWFRVASLGHVPFLLSLVAVVRRWLPRSLATGALMGTFVLAAAAPVLADNRAGVALLLLDGALVRYYLGGGFQFRSAMRSIAGGLIAIIGMLSVRTGGAGRAGLSIFEQAFLGRDLMDVSKLAQVVAMPEVAPLGGQTLYGWLLAPFPEAWFASKPLWSGLGQYVWQEAYGSGGINGVHPGLFGELYLNFWWPGLVVGGLLFGMVLRWIYLSFRPVVHNPAGAIVYVTVIVHLVFFGLSNDLGTGILSALLDALPLVVVAWILGRSPVRPIGPRFSETEGRPLAGSSRRRD